MDTRQRRLDRIAQMIRRRNQQDIGERGLASLIGHTGFDDGGDGYGRGSEPQPSTGLASLLTPDEWQWLCSE
jgi:hypothetical protein